MMLLTLLFSFFGSYSPENRGTIVNLLLLFYILLSFVNGYLATRLYVSFDGKQIKRLIAVTASALPRSSSRLLPRSHLLHHPPGAADARHLPA